MSCMFPVWDISIERRSMVLFECRDVVMYTSQNSSFYNFILLSIRLVQEKSRKFPQHQTFYNTSSFLYNLW